MILWFSASKPQQFLNNFVPEFRAFLKNCRDVAVVLEQLFSLGADLKEGSPFWHYLIQAFYGNLKVPDLKKPNVLAASKYITKNFKQLNALFMDDMAQSTAERLRELESQYPEFFQPAEPSGTGPNHNQI